MLILPQKSKAHWENRDKEMNCGSRVWGAPQSGEGVANGGPEGH